MSQRAEMFKINCKDEELQEKHRASAWYKIEKMYCADCDKRPDSVQLHGTGPFRMLPVVVHMACLMNLEEPEDQRGIECVCGGQVHLQGRYV